MIQAKVAHRSDRKNSAKVGLFRLERASVGKPTVVPTERVSSEFPAASTISPLECGQPLDVVSKSRMADLMAAGLRCM